jgi:hypothetical protein
MASLLYRFHAVVYTQVNLFSAMVSHHLVDQVDDLLGSLWAPKLLDSHSVALKALASANVVSSLGQFVRSGFARHEVLGRSGYSTLQIHLVVYCRARSPGRLVAPASLVTRARPIHADFVTHLFTFARAGPPTQIMFRSSLSTTRIAGHAPNIGWETRVVVR